MHCILQYDHTVSPLHIILGQVCLMTSRYRVEYHLKSHRRDELIEWIKGLLVVPFVLVRELNGHTQNLVRDRYAGVFADVEGLIDDHSSY